MEALAELEGEAEQALRLANADSQRVVGVLSIAKSLGLVVEWVPGSELRRGALASIIGQLIRVRTGLSPVNERFVVAHEVGHHLLRHRRHEEADADYIAAAIVVPRRALLCARRYLGDDLEALASAFTASQTSVALRLAESGAVVAVAVVGPGIVRARASVEFEFPDETTLRKLAKSERMNNYVKRSALTDDVRRVALMVEEE